MKNPEWFYDEDDQLHREDGPAVMAGDIEVWYIHGVRHRVDGPAYYNSQGYKEWIRNGKCHREDGPAVIHTDGSCEWYINGKQVPCKTQEEFDHLMKLKSFW